MCIIFIVRIIIWPQIQLLTKKNQVILAPSYFIFIYLLFIFFSVPRPVVLVCGDEMLNVLLTQEKTQKQNGANARTNLSLRRNALNTNAKVSSTVNRVFYGLSGVIKPLGILRRTREKKLVNHDPDRTAL